MTNRRDLAIEGKSELLLQSIQILIDLCAHEYVAVNRKALHSFVKVAPKYGKKALIGVKPLFHILTVPGTSYASASGALSCLAQDVSIKNITSDWNSTEQFICMILLFPGMIERVVEPDKRQQLMTKLTSLFVQYVEKWHHYPLSHNYEQSVSTSKVFQLLLKSVGYELNGNKLSDSPTPSDTTSNTTEEVSSSKGSSLRHDMFVSFLMLHFIGHSDIEIPSGVVAWALKTVSTAHGQPTQNVAMAALVRMSFMLCKKLSPSILKGPQSTPHLITPTVIESINYLRSTFSSPSQWLPLLQGVSQSHTKSGEDGGSAQWSLGIDHILHCSKYMEYIYPRKLATSRFGNFNFSSHYETSHAGMFLSLACVLTKSVPTITTTVTTTTVIPSNHSVLETIISTESNGYGLKQTDTMNVLTVINTALSASKLLSSTNEEETRTNNLTRAELFGGLLRGFLLLFDEQMKNIPQASSSSLARTQIEKDAYQVEEVLVNYFSENVDKLSLDYYTPWTEAVATVISDGYCKIGNPLFTYIIDGFRRVLRVSTISSTLFSASAVSVVVDSNGEIEVESVSMSGVEVDVEEVIVNEEVGLIKEKGDVDKGFARQGNTLMLTRAALTGELNYSSMLNLHSKSDSTYGVSTGTSPTLGFGSLVAEILCESDSDFLSTSRNCRIQIGQILALLSENGLDSSLDLSAVLLKISNTVNAGSDILRVDQISMDVANVALEAIGVVSGKNIIST